MSLTPTLAICLLEYNLCSTDSLEQVFESLTAVGIRDRKPLFLISTVSNHGRRYENSLLFCVC
jgi:hypothetical protein